MKQSILASRRQIAIEAIAEHTQRISGQPLDLKTGIKGNTVHKQLFMLERMAAFMESMGNTSTIETVDGFTLDDILAIDGLSKAAKKSITAALGN